MAKPGKPAPSGISRGMSRAGRVPRWAGPHQPRLDWQMRFAALRDARLNPWAFRLMQGLLTGAAPVTRFWSMIRSRARASSIHSSRLSVLSLFRGGPGRGRVIRQFSAHNPLKTSPCEGEALSERRDGWIGDGRAAASGAGRVVRLSVQRLAHRTRYGPVVEAGLDGALLSARFADVDAANGADVTDLERRSGVCGVGHHRGLSLNVARS
jgi:hypothetical protein